ncbi:hypothetical protein Q2K19_17305 [Micromonospora soli]|uniref:hypothetical protein n=1 Tax=Micromonospora sp. NBRC 110009 TaxID=3061627 RepID=UPI002671755D|nr:hypothetical protein [Micromonospora sp. NBRC 110009]WKT96007.1 hypothetical protein Q2K19_17305 [Micromonospora sp. NBRC 110009]
MTATTGLELRHIMRGLDLFFEVDSGATAVRVLDAMANGHPDHGVQGDQTQHPRT